MRVMITRPREDAEPLCELLADRGIETMVEPLLSIDYTTGPPLDLTGIQACLLTSANGVRALIQRSPARELPVFAVGDATARTAMAAGFTDVRSAAGDVEALADLAIGALNAEAGALLHPAGSKVAGDLAGYLQKAGFDYRRETLYSATPAQAFSAAAREALNSGDLAGVLIFSPRTGTTFRALVEAADLTPSIRPLTAYCLSPAVADQVAELPWRALETAARPDQAALLDLLS